MEVLVPSAVGFIGSHLMNRLLRETQRYLWFYHLYDEQLNDCKGHVRLAMTRGDIREDDDRLDQFVQAPLGLILVSTSRGCWGWSG